jgi:single-stranded-DNA-specific exonuclease
VVRRWTWRAEGDEVPRTLVDAVAGLNLPAPELLARLLWNRDVRSPEDAAAFLRPSLSHGLRSPLLLKDMDRAARRLADALAAGERIAVYGDYDVDGMTGAALLVVFFRALGVEPLLHVAHRAREGYGLHAGALRALRDAGARVVVTADLGTANVAELGLAADLGLDVIVCDHHHAPAERPPAWALLNPFQPGCSFPFKGLSGAGVVFYLLMGLRMELRARGHAGLPDLRPYLDLVALGAVADVVPLREENRVLVAHGLRRLDETQRPGLQALKELALVESASARGIGFRLAPRLNAGGRLADARTAVELLTTASQQRGRELAAILEVYNAERRAIEDAMLRDAVAMAEEQVGRDGAWTTLVAREGWHPGVAGIVAARLCERFHRPAVVIALAGDVGRGSGRSVRGVDLHAALAECRDVLEAFGGHRQAIGLTVRREQVPVLAARFEASVRRISTPADLEPLLQVDAEVSLTAMTPALGVALAGLEPHGMGNPEPVFVARGVGVESVRMVGSTERLHLKLRLRQDGRTVPAIGFGLGHLPVNAGDVVDVVFTPRLSRWQGRDRLELEVGDVRLSAARNLPQHIEKTRTLAVP